MSQNAREADTALLEPLDRLRFELDHPPFHQFLRPEPVSVDAEAGSVVIRLPFRPEFARIPDRPDYHGGVIAAFIDITAHAAAAVKAGRMAPTVDLRIDYMRVASGSALIGRGTVQRMGRTLAVVDVEITTEGDGRQIALGRGVLSVRSD
ncbi:PaaI family thioesterase [Enterovirga rhinocerotis]|uniref:Medium/long-chain acyl-CoA thioesterase YigI n=1 Tax=Enterovirga rhinocerotis TaxID=1339210 RepID=A0A4R7C472_9HYPH|nr:PaaI family thioesterase [Enterovirga rhinocerotis]TDR92941.1 uncharacterized protein (TIGR00369 family) [Enterovirga rhinocerotis]